MKKIAALLVLAATFQGTYAQNVGIGNTSPLSRLDVDGDIAVRSAEIYITTTYNYALDVSSLKQSTYKLRQQIIPIVGNFILAGINGGVDGRIISLSNRTMFSMEIYNEDATASAENRIMTGTGTTLAIYNGGNVTLQYDASDQRWIVKGAHYNNLNYFGGGGGTSYWNLNGNHISSTNSGNVGIGTTAPLKKLDVKGNGSFEGSTMSGVQGGALEINSNDLAGTATQFLHLDGQRIQSFGSPNIQTATTARDFLINPFGGKVGIGVFSSPRARLSISSSTVMANNNTELLQVIGKNPVIVFSDQNLEDHGYIKLVTDRTNTPQFDDEGLEIGAPPGHNLYLSANYSPAITVCQNNNVGIGTNTPTQKLSVNGNIRAKEITVETGWADYVFSEDYKLLSLEKLEKFISEKNHLPNIPSAKDVEEKGLSLGDMQRRMMEKIEELTLYILELKKEIDLLKK